MKKTTVPWKIKTAEFVISAANINQLPKIDMPEYAFIGRSNAGKSTLLNRLCGRKALARVSSTPGKTQQINLYLVTLTNGSKNKEIYLADLPGYGYAKVSQSTRTDLADLVVSYFDTRPQLKLVFLLSDIKRTADSTDAQVRNLIYKTGRSVQVVLTKSDKLNQKEKSASIKANSANLSLEPGDLLLVGTDAEPANILERINVNLEME